jgi:hypothetical protein
MGKIKIVNLIKMHHYTINMRCEQYIDWYTLVFHTWKKKVVTYEKLRDGIHFLPFKTITNYSLPSVLGTLRIFSTCLDIGRVGIFSKCDSKKLSHFQVYGQGKIIVNLLIIEITPIHY